MGNEISWLLPVALFVIVFGGYLGCVADSAATKGPSAWSGWLVVTGLVFTYMNGTVHPYYTVALAPAVAALVGLGSVWAWRHRAGWDGRTGLAAMSRSGRWWSAILLNRNHFGTPWAPWAVTSVATLTVIGAVH